MPVTPAEKEAVASLAGPAGLAAEGGTAALSGVGQDVVNDALKPLFQASIWKRMGEVSVGLILLAIGVNALFKNKPLSIVTSGAGALGKVAP